MATIRLVRNDTGPQLRFTLTDNLTGNPINLTGATVTLHFRAVNTTALLFSRQAVVVPPGTNGVAVLQFDDDDLDLDAGEYEGEVEVVTSDGLRETIYNVLQFALREDFA
jgi:hypothetical protein